MQFPCSYFLRSSLLSGHFVEVEFLSVAVLSWAFLADRQFLDCQFIETAQESILYALYGLNDESRFQLMVVQRFMLSFIRTAVEKRKYGVDFCCIFRRPDW